MLAFLFNLIRILGILLLVRLVLRALAPRRGAVGPVSSGERSSDLVRDRVCNTFVPRERALRGQVAGREEFFCSPACRERGLQRGAVSPPPP